MSPKVKISFFLHLPTARDTLIRPSSPRRTECIWFVPRFESDKRYIPKIGFPFCVWLGVRLFVVVVWLIGVCAVFCLPPLSKTARQSSRLVPALKSESESVVSVRIFRKCFMCWLNAELWLNKPHFHCALKHTAHAENTYSSGCYPFGLGLANFAIRNTTRSIFNCRRNWAGFTIIGGFGTCEMIVITSGFTNSFKTVEMKVSEMLYF